MRVAADRRDARTSKVELGQSIASVVHERDQKATEARVNVQRNVILDSDV